MQIWYLIPDKLRWVLLCVEMRFITYIYHVSSFYSLEFQEKMQLWDIFTLGKQNSNVFYFDEGHRSSFASHFLSRCGSCKNRAPGEWASEKQLTSALCWPVITAPHSHCSQPNRSWGPTGFHCQAGSPRSASEARAKPRPSHVPAEGAIFCKSE